MVKEPCKENNLKPDSSLRPDLPDKKYNIYRDLTHLDTKGEGMGERTAHGHIFLLHLFFRPPLMVIGLTLGWLSMNILGAFLKGMLI